MTETQKANEAPSLKVQMDALTDVVEKLEDPEVSLEESLTLYEQGMALVADATKTLEQAQQRISLITASDEQETLQP